MKTRNEKSSVYYKKSLRRIYLFTFIVMAITGFGQMPIFKRYYLADIPGFAWTANYYFTHYIHYLGAIFLLGLFTYLVVDYFLIGRKQLQLTYFSSIRLFFMTGIVLSGIFRMLKNMQNIVFAPGFIFFIDIAHLGLVIVFALLAFLFRMSYRFFPRTTTKAPSP